MFVILHRFIIKFITILNSVGLPQNALNSTTVIKKLFVSNFGKKLTDIKIMLSPSLNLRIEAYSLFSAGSTFPPTNFQLCGQYTIFLYYTTFKRKSQRKIYHIFLSCLLSIKSTYNSGFPAYARKSPW